MFYMFLLPFVGTITLKNVIIGLYSAVVSYLEPNQYFSILNSVYNLILALFQAFVVFVLYIRCAAIDPSDPGILASVSKTKKSGFVETNVPEKQAISSNKVHDVESPMLTVKQILKKEKQWCTLLCLVEDDICQRNHIENQLTAEGNTLFCTLCNAEVRFILDYPIRMISDFITVAHIPQSIQSCM